MHLFDLRATLGCGCREYSFLSNGELDRWKQLMETWAHQGWESVIGCSPKMLLTEDRSSIRGFFFGDKFVAMRGTDSWLQKLLIKHGDVATRGRSDESEEDASADDRRSRRAVLVCGSKRSRSAKSKHRRKAKKTHKRKVGLLA